LPARHGLQPNISVIVSLETLAGIEDEPGWLDGYGPITADTARALAADDTGTWRRLVIDPIFGQVIDFGTTRYRPPTHLAELVIARDGTCVFPTCNRPARACDLDITARSRTAIPVRRTSGRNVDGNTASSTKRPGRSDETRTAPPPGPAPKAANTPTTRPNAGKSQANSAALSPREFCHARF